MNNIKEFYRNLKDFMKIPIAYDHFENKTSPPFIAYFDEGKETFVADGTTYTKNIKIRIELYTINKDIEIESKLEKFFDKNKILWEDDETMYIENEKIYKHDYYIKI